MDAKRQDSIENRLAEMTADRDNLIVTIEQVLELLHWMCSQPWFTHLAGIAILRFVEEKLKRAVDEAEKRDTPF